MIDMHAAAPVPVSEYLNTRYRPDYDYIDGRLLERNVGELDHSRLQGLVSCYLANRETQWGIFVTLGPRIRITETRFRVPDIVVITGRLPSSPIVTEPPFLCVEILSQHDQRSEMRDRVKDYLSFGVPYVWLIDARTRRAHIHSSAGIRAARGVLTTENPDIRVVLSELE
jgi:Uma2 family endonuclease